jgi:hypothetical protein
MKTKEIMPGVEEVGSSAIHDSLVEVMEIANVVKRIPKRAEQMTMTLFGAHRGFASLVFEIDTLKRCDALAKEFKVVRRDQTPVNRKIRLPMRDSWNRGTDKFQEWDFSAPLAWAVKLPSKKEFEMQSGGLLVRALVPPPPVEAVEQLKKHGKKFDRTEVWWVPKDILVLRPPSPDPIVVGIVGTQTLGEFCFELHRWIDEDYENSYWAKEGY